MTHADWAARWAVYHPDKMAFKAHETGQTLTFAELNRLGNRLAHHLTTERGLAKGDRVAVLAENGLEHLILFAAAQKTGIIIVPLNYRLAATEIDYLLANAAPRMVIWEDKFAELLAATAALGQVEHRWPLEALAKYCDKQLPHPTDTDFPAVKIADNDPIFILYTSGTTGFPKGALYTHKMLFWNSINTALSLLVNTDSRTINCMPPFHTGGWNVLTTPFLHHGGYSCLLRKFDAATVLELLETERPTIFMGVPTMLKMLADEPAFERANFSSLHYIIVGGEPLPLPLIERWHTKGVPIRQGYGMTEVGPNLTSLHQADAIRKKGSIGRPNFYVQTRIADEHGRPAAPGQDGELLLRGPMVTPGYWQHPDATADAIRDGWFHTGDRVREDDEGYLYVVDRIKNMFISGGENVYPAEVERVLLQHPDIVEAAVIGVPHARWGEVGQAFVVLREGGTADADAITDHCRRHLAKYKVPHAVGFVAALPKNDTGKINRQALKSLI